MQVAKEGRSQGGKPWFPSLAFSALRVPKGRFRGKIGMGWAYSTNLMKLRAYQLLLLLVLFTVWYVLTETEILPPFFFGKPLVVLEKAWEWFASGKIYVHLGVTLIETVLAFLV